MMLNKRINIIKLLAFSPVSTRYPRRELLMLFWRHRGSIGYRLTSHHNNQHLITYDNTAREKWMQGQQNRHINLIPTKWPHPTLSIENRCLHFLSAVNSHYCINSIDVLLLQGLLIIHQSQRQQKELEPLTSFKTKCRASKDRDVISLRRVLDCFFRDEVYISHFIIQTNGLEKLFTFPKCPPDLN